MEWHRCNDRCHFGVHCDERETAEARYERDAEEELRAQYRGLGVDVVSIEPAPRADGVTVLDESARTWVVCWRVSGNAPG